MIALLPLLLIIGLVLYFTRSKVTSKLSVSTKWTYRLFAIYLSILLIVTFAIVVLDNKISVSLPDKSSEEEVFRVDDLLRRGDLESVNSSQIFNESVHEVEDTLILFTSSPYSNATIYIERKDTNDGLIEETLLKPLLLVNDMDFSSRLNYTKTVWNTDSTTKHTKLTLPEQPASRISYVSYKDASVLGQFTASSRQSTRFQSSVSRDIAVYLRVPKDLKISTDETVYIEYVNE